MGQFRVVISVVGESALNGFQLLCKRQGPRHYYNGRALELVPYTIGKVFASENYEKSEFLFC